MRTKVRLASLILITLTVALISAPDGAIRTQLASAHVYRPTSHGKDWYFYGSTFTDDDDRDRKDPVNIIFKGGEGLHNADDIALDIDAIWDDHWGNMKRRFCRDDQRMVWRDLHGHNITDRTDQHQMTNCGPGSQYHIRIWDDHEHAKITEHGSLGQWSVGGVHYETFGLKFPCCFHHKITRDWDAVRSQAVSALHDFCSYRRWRYHAGADRTYQGYTNSGYIARISRRLVRKFDFSEPNCRGA
jgi:hypothetical protein